MPHIKTLLFTLLIVSFLYPNLNAQSPSFYHITDKEGLPSMTIYDMLQDEKGYIWLGTDAGLCRYDGYKFYTYDIPSSLGNGFTNFKKDQKGRIYFQNFSGQIFYIDKQKIEEIKLPKAMQGYELKSYIIDNKDQVWVLSNQLYKLDKKTNTWKAFDLSRIGRYNAIDLMTIDQNGKVCLLDKNRHFYTVQNEEIKRCVSKDIKPVINYIGYLDKQLIAYNFYERSIYKYDAKKEKWIPAFTQAKDLLEGTMTHISKDNKDNVWIASDKGLFVYTNPQKNSASYSSKLVFLKDRFISKVIQDREGNYWIASIGKGLYMMSNKDILNYNNDNSLLDIDNANCLREDHKGRLIIGTNDNKVFRFDTKKQKIHTYYLPLGDVECLYFDKNTNKLFIENGNLLVFELEDSTSAYQLYTNVTPKDIAVYKKENLVVATGHGAEIVNINPKKALINTKYSKNFNYEGDRLLLRQIRSRAVCVERQTDRFWVAYADGLYYYENAKAHELKTKAGKAIIGLSMTQDVEDVLWIGTIKQGVFAIKNKRIIRHITAEKGVLLSNLCKVIKIDKNNLWLGTDKGIQVLNLNTSKSIIIDQKDGLVSNEIRDLLIQQRKVWVATADGLTVLDKNYTNKNNTPPLIHITGFEIAERAQKLKKSYQLSYHKNNIKIEFCGIAFRSMGKFRYKYRLLGLSEKWIYIESNTNFVRYPSLPSGRYEFQIKAINEDGVESKKTAILRIEIAYPIWQKWWFVTLAIFSGIMLISAFFMLRIRTIKRRNQLKNQLLNANLDALKVQMNPHFIFNSLSVIQTYILEEKGEEADRYLSKFARLTRQILEASRKDYISISEEVEILTNYILLEQSIAEHKFDYKFRIAENIDRENIAIPPLFIQPFVENAIKHGVASLKNEGKIRIHFSLYQKLILVEIVDNGIGRKRTEKFNINKKHRSLATKITNERIELLQNSIKKTIRLDIEDILSEKQEVLGTKVKLFLPYKVI